MRMGEAWLGSTPALVLYSEVTTYAAQLVVSGKSTCSVPWMRSSVCCTVEVDNGGWDVCKVIRVINVEASVWLKAALPLGACGQWSLPTLQLIRLRFVPFEACLVVMQCPRIQWHQRYKLHYLWSEDYARLHLAIVHLCITCSMWLLCSSSRRGGTPNGSGGDLSPTPLDYPSLLVLKLCTNNTNFDKHCC